MAEADLCSLLPASAPQVETVEGNCTTERKVLLVFKNPQDANQAFKELQVIIPSSAKELTVKAGIRVTQNVLRKM